MNLVICFCQILKDTMRIPKRHIKYLVLKLDKNISTKIVSTNVIVMNLNKQLKQKTWIKFRRLPLKLFLLFVEF